MIGFFDNDVIVKLALCNLLNECVATYGITECWALETLEYRILRKPPHRIEKIFESHPDIKTRIAEFHQQCMHTSDAVEDIEFLEACSDITNIDPGETVLLSYARRTESKMLLSGDKKFFRAIAQNPQLHDWLTGMENCILSFDQIMLSFLNTHGYSVISGKAKLLCEYDQGMKLIFRDHLENPEKNCRQGLDSNINELERTIPSFMHTELETRTGT